MCAQSLEARILYFLSNWHHNIQAYIWWCHKVYRYRVSVFAAHFERTGTYWQSVSGGERPMRLQRLNIKHLLVAIIVVVIPLLGLATITQAQTFRSGDNVTVPAGKTVDNTLFVAGRTLDIAGNVNGDLFCAGENVTVSGRVQGDVMCAAQNVTVTGDVTGDVRLAGQSVTLGAAVAGNATIAAQSFVQQGRSNVGGDLSIGSNDVALNGRVGRDVAAGATTVTIAGPVGRNIQAEVNKLQLDSGARVRGNITYTSSNTLNRAQGAVVEGSITRQTPSKEKKAAPAPLFGWLFALYLYLATILVALILALLLPGLFERAVAATNGRKGRAFLIGLISSIVVPIILSVIMLTVIGIPLALLAGLFWLLLVILASFVAAYMLGRRILSKSQSPVLVMLVGSAIFFLISLIPIVGWILWLVGTWFGLGALLMLGRDTGRPYRETGARLPSAKKAK